MMKGSKSRLTIETSLIIKPSVTDSVHHKRCQRAAPLVPPGLVAVTLYDATPYAATFGYYCLVH